MAATMGSEMTAAATGTVGEVRRDPFAMLPFCGYHVGDYFAHWLSMGSRIAHPPHIFSVNWFRKDEAGQFLWPGFGAQHARPQVDLRALRRARRRDARRRSASCPLSTTSTGRGSSSRRERFAQAIGVDVEAWQRELAAHDELFARVGEKQPAALAVERDKLGGRLAR